MTTPNTPNILTRWPAYKIKLRGCDGVHIDFPDFCSEYVPHAGQTVIALGKRFIVMSVAHDLDAGIIELSVAGGRQLLTGSPI